MEEYGIKKEILDADRVGKINNFSYFYIHGKLIC